MNTSDRRDSLNAPQKLSDFYSFQNDEFGNCYLLKTIHHILFSVVQKNGIALGMP